MITSHPFGTTAAGQAVTRFRLQNGRGAYADILDYGGAIQSLCLWDKAGKLADVSLGYDHVAGYERGVAHLGALLGRYANRLCGAKYAIGGREVPVNANEGGKCLHGGAGGFDRQMWLAEPQGEDTLLLTRLSPDGEEGFEGNLEAQVTYCLTEGNALSIAYRATTDAPTVVSLSNHCYFNLGGHAAGDVLAHQVQIFADSYTEADAQMRTTGRVLPVAGTVLDFRAPKPLGRDMLDPFIASTQGFDHNFVLAGQGMRQAARAYCPATGLAMDVYTDQPGMQLYTGNFLSDVGKGGAAYGQYGAFCMETQNFPDAPNHPGFPSAVLRPGEVYETRTVYAFGVREGI